MFYNEFSHGKLSRAQYCFVILASYFSAVIVMIPFLIPLMLAMPRPPLFSIWASLVIAMDTLPTMLRLNDIGYRKKVVILPFISFIAIVMCWLWWFFIKLTKLLVYWGLLHENSEKEWGLFAETIKANQMAISGLTLYIVCIFCFILMLTKRKIGLDNYDTNSLQG